MKIEFEYTWCDYLTPCPHGRDCFVGDYDCSTCEFCGEIKTLSSTDDSLNYSKYVKVYKGYIKCKKINKIC